MPSRNGADILARRLGAEAAFQEGAKAEEIGKKLAAFARAVSQSPDIPAYRLGFAASLARLDPAISAEPGVSRMLKQAGVFASLATVLAQGGRAAVAAEPFGSRWLLGSRPFVDALEHAGSAAPRDIDRALCGPPLRRGATASIFQALLPGVLIQEPSLLAHLEQLRHNFARAALSTTKVRLSPPAARVLELLAQQVWIQDGLLVRPPDADFLARLAKPKGSATLDLARRLFQGLGYGPTRAVTGSAGWQGERFLIKPAMPVNSEAVDF